MMTTDQKRICFELSDAGVAEFSELSMRTRMDTDFLRRTLDDLVTRGFVLHDKHLYRLADGVRQQLLST